MGYIDEEATGTPRAEQVEEGVRVEGDTTTKEGSLFVCSYTVDLDVLERYARLNVLRRQRTAAAFVAIAALFTALLVLTTDLSLWPVALACVVLGLAMVAWHRRSPTATARRLLQGIPPERTQRTVRFFPDRAELETGDGSVRAYTLASLCELRLDDDMAVFVFGPHGATVPCESMAQGTWEELLVWGRDHIVHEGSGSTRRGAKGGE